MELQKQGSKFTQFSTLSALNRQNGWFAVPTLTHAVRLEDVATVAVAVELGSVELENSALRLVVECD